MRKMAKFHSLVLPNSETVWLSRLGRHRYAGGQVCAPSIKTKTSVRSPWWARASVKFPDFARLSLRFGKITYSAILVAPKEAKGHRTYKIRLSNLTDLTSFEKPFLASLIEFSYKANMLSWKHSVEGSAGDRASVSYRRGEGSRRTFQGRWAPAFIGLNLWISWQLFPDVQVNNCCSIYQPSR